MKTKAISFSNISSSHSVKRNVVLKLVQDTGRALNNKKLPVGCHYCELKWENMGW